MLHFLHRLLAGASRDSQMPAPIGLTLPFLTIAFASIAIPSMLYPRILDGSVSDALAPKELWAALWPVLLGGVLFIALRRWGYLLPRVPEGDVLVLGERSNVVAHELGATMEHLNRGLSQWPVASVLLVVLTTLFIATMLAGH